MKHCRKCGGALVDEARACIHCGVRLDGEGGASDAPNAAVALLAVFAARYERRYRAAGAPDGIDVHDAPETPSCTQPAFRLE